jgi:hypothetical protein
MKASEAFKSSSKYFKAATFDRSRVLEVECVRFEKIGQGDDAQEKAVAYFRRERLGLVMNMTLWEQFAKITGDEDSDGWRGHLVELFKDKTKFKGDYVDCIRARKPPEAPKKTAAKRPALDDDISDVA